MSPFPREAAAGRSGVALASAVLFALIVLMLGHGVLLVGRTQRWIVAVDGARWVDEARRRAALMGAVKDLDSLPTPGSLRTRWGEVEVRGLGPELRTLRVEPADSDPGAAWVTVLAAPSPVVRAGARNAAARVRGPSFDSGGHGRAAGGEEPCPPGLDGRSAARVGPFPPGTEAPHLGALDLADLLAALPGLPGARLQLPTSDPSDCAEAGAFGDPRRPGSCPEVWGAGSWGGDLGVSGRGQGALAVGGNLTLRREARFRGWLWVGGELRLEAGAEFRGLLDVGGRFVVQPGGAFEPDECAGARALEVTRELRRPIRVGPNSWPLFRP